MNEGEGNSTLPQPPQEGNVPMAYTTYQQPTEAIGSHPVNPEVIEKRRAYAGIRQRLGEHLRKTVIVCSGLVIIAGVLAYIFLPSVQLGASNFFARIVNTQIHCLPDHPALFRVCDVFGLAELREGQVTDKGIAGEATYQDGLVDGGGDPLAPNTGNPSIIGASSPITHSRVVNTAQENNYIEAVKGTEENSGTGTAEETSSVNPKVNKPAIPTQLKLAVDSAAQIAASWSSASGATQYQVKIFTSGNERLVSTGSTNVKIGGLSAQTTYGISVRAVNAAGYSEWSQVVSATTSSRTPDKPGTVAGLKVSGVSVSGFELSWNSTSNATSYSILRASDGAFTQNVKEYAVGNIQKYKVSDLQSGVTYFIKVRASNQGALGGWSSTVSERTTLAVPATIKVTASKRGEVVIEWGKVTGASSYEIQYANNSAMLFASSKNSTATSTTITGLGDAAEYHVKVRAKSNQQESGWTKQVTIKTVQAPPSKPAAPKLVADSHAVVTATWGVADRAASYVVTYEGGGSTITKYITGTTIKLVDLKGSTNYTVKVRAVNSTGEGEWSSSSSIKTPLQAPGAPSSLTAISRSESSVVLGWSAMERATRYTVSYSTQSSMAESKAVSGIKTAQTTISNLASGTTYYFTVVAINDAGAGANSPIVSTLTLPNSPAIASIAPVTDSMNIKLSWNATKGATSYKVRYSKNSDLSNNTVVTTQASSLVISKLTKTTKYFFQVQAVNEAGASSWSAAKNATTLSSYDIRVMTYNVFGSNAGGSEAWPWAKRKQGVIDAINNSNADVIGLQEVRNSEDQLKNITSGTSGKYAYPSYDAKVPQSYLRLILYKPAVFELLSNGTEEILKADSLAMDADKVARFGAFYGMKTTNWVLLKHKKSGQKILVFNVHMPVEGDVGRNVAAKNLQTRVEKVKEKVGNAPTFITGDFNQYETSPAWLPRMTGLGLVDGFSKASVRTNESYGTYSDFRLDQKNGRHIDRIFVSNASVSVSEWMIKLSATTTIDGQKRPASDHWPVALDVEVLF